MTITLLATFTASDRRMGRTSCAAAGPAWVGSYKCNLQNELSGCNEQMAGELRTFASLCEAAMIADLVSRSLLRRAALRYADRGWPVFPGAYLNSDRYACGPLCPTVACHPAVEHWDKAASTDAADVAIWWDRQAYSVLLATGRAFDVIEVPARIGLPASRAAVLGPVAVSPVGRWMFLVEPGDALRPELAEQLDVVMHGSGSWIPAPPTRTLDGRIRWEVPPAVTEWRLPDPYAVQKALLAHARPPARVPTFASTTRAIQGAA